MAESLNEIIAQQRIRSYEISIWTLQDRFLSILKWAEMDQKGQVQDPEMTLRDDGTEELSFTIPKFYYSGAERIQNPMWLHLKDQPLEANMHKLKVIFNKNYEDERVFEFLVTSVASDHTQNRVDINVKAEGLAFHELGKVGYKIALSQENYELELKNWIEHGMHGDKPQMNIQYWNDLIFKDSDGNWRTNWQYEVRMDWSSYSRGNKEKDSSRVYEDEYVSSWQLDENEKLVPRNTEGLKEKWHPVEIKESNIYNATQTIAEQFGVFCRYEYEHDENYQITGKRVIYYNNYLYDVEGHIDLTYPYSSSGITRTIDNSNVTTKMFVTNVEENSTTISIMDVEANKSREDYLLCFDYLKDIDGINEDQYEAIQEYEAKMYKYNTSLSSVQERIRILTNQLIQLEADYTTYNNAYKLDDERYEEAKKGFNSITGGKQLIPVDTNFIVMEDNKNGLGLYIKMRFEGMVSSSIKLYAKNNFASMNGSQYSEPVLFSPKYDDQGNLTYLYNLQGKIEEGDSVFLSGMRDPYSYYQKLMEIWTQRKNTDEIKRNEAEEKTTLYNWYLHGSRVGYGLVGSAQVDAAYFGIMTVVPFEGTEEELATFNLAHPYVTWYVGGGRAGNSGEIYDYNDEYDHFEQEDKIAETADLYYFQDYFLKQKELEYNRLERMLGPALREGYWTPEDYHNYGDQYEASFQLNAKMDEIKGEDTKNLNNFIYGSRVYAFHPDAALAPHLQVLWDCNKYYEDEEPLIYTSSISDNKDQHLIVDLSKYMKIVQDHLDDLCLFYAALPNVRTIDDISGLISGSQSTKLSVIEADFQRFTRGIYNDNARVGTNYYNKLWVFIHATPNSNETNNKVIELFHDPDEALGKLRTEVSNISSGNKYYANLEQADVDKLVDIANKIYNISTQYEQIKNKQITVKNASAKDSDAYNNATKAITYANNYIAQLNAAYEYLMGNDASVYNWNKVIDDPTVAQGAHWSTSDSGLIIYIKQYYLYKEWLTSLTNNCYYGLPVNSQGELGWVLDTQNQGTESNPKYIRFPAFIVTGAKTLDADTIRFIVTNQYTIEDLNGDTVTRQVKNDEFGENYKPFLGYYLLEKNPDGTSTLNPKVLVRLKPTDFIGAGLDCTANYTRTLIKQDYDNNSMPRQARANEYRYRRVYPRLFFNTIKLMDGPTDLYVNINGNTLENFKNYSLIMDDRSVGQNAQGIGYYLTLKAPF